jgi:hypothetical protein
MYPKDFSAVLAIGLILICAYLLITAKLSGWQFGFALFASAFIVIGLHNIDNIGKLSVKGGGVDAVMEVRELRNEVFAKVDELKKIAAGIGTFTVASIVGEGRFVGSDHQDRMLDRRDQLDAFLKDAGIDDEQRSRTISPITRMVDFDYRRRIVINAVAKWRLPPGANPVEPPEREKFERDVEKALQQSDRIKGLQEAESLIRHLYDPANPILIESVDRYRKALTTGRLPSTGPQDDLRVAPPR